jgi:hypothetical protein
MPFQVSASMNGGALMVIVETAAATLEKMAELIELGHADVLVKDLDGRLVDLAQLQIEVAAP